MKNEPEFIVNSEDLKKNQERVLKMQEDLKKSQERLEEEQQVAQQINFIAICFGIIFLIISVLYIYNSGKEAVESCVNAGHSVSFCESNL